MSRGCSQRGESCPGTHTQTPSRRALRGQEEPGLPNKQLFNILFSPHCSVRGLEPSPALNTEPGVFLQAFRRSHPEWGSALCVFTVKHPRFPNGKLRNEKKKCKKIRAAASRFLQRACEAPPKGLLFWATSQVQSTAPPWCSLRLCILSTSAARSPGSYLCAAPFVCLQLL